MSQAASQAAAFYREVAANKVVWTMECDGGLPMIKNGAEQSVIGFWSSESRVKKIIREQPKYANYTPVSISWDEFCTKWIKDFQKGGIQIGVNWSGKNMLGYDIEPKRLVANVRANMPQSDEPKNFLQRLFGTGKH